MAMVWSRLLALALLFTPLNAWSEYRVFLLKIEKAGSTEAPEETSARFVESTLDPVQYRGYYPVADDEIITYVDTWRCRGRTDGKPHCPNPRAPASLPEGPDSP